MRLYCFWRGRLLDLQPWLMYPLFSDSRKIFCRWYILIISGMTEGCTHIGRASFFFQPFTCLRLICNIVCTSYIMVCGRLHLLSIVFTVWELLWIGYDDCCKLSDIVFWRSDRNLAGQWLDGIAYVSAVQPGFFAAKMGFGYFCDLWQPNHVLYHNCVRPGLCLQNTYVWKLRKNCRFVLMLFIRWVFLHFFKYLID